MHFIRILKSAFKDNFTQLEAPNYETPSLTEEKLNIDSNAFKSWFGNSKVIDSDGEPLRVYHGTTREFEEFNKDFIASGTDRGFYGEGFYFTNRKIKAKDYGKKIHSCYLKIENPFYYDWIAYPDKFSLDKDKLLNLLVNLKVFTISEVDIPYYNTLSKADKKSYYKAMISFLEHPKAFSDLIKENGYDGIIYLKAREWIVFEPNQIKTIYVK